MNWLFIVFARILIGNGLFPIIIKNIVGLPSRTRRFAWQFFFCVIFAVVIGLTISPLKFSWATWAILGLGFFNGLAALAQWKAIDISLSKTSIFTFWDDVIAMGLSYFILNERQYLSTWMYIGICLSLGAVIGFSIHSQKTHDGKNKKTPLKFFIYVGFYSLIWGVAMFLMRYFGIAKVSGGSFLIPWYASAFIAAMVILFFYKQDQAQNKSKTKLKFRDIGIMSILAFIIFVSLGLAYIAYQLKPQTIIQPFFLIGEMIVPTVIGLYLFKERKKLDTWEKIYFLIAISGGLLIAFNVH